MPGTRGEGLWTELFNSELINSELINSERFNSCRNSAPWLSSAACLVPIHSCFPPLKIPAAENRRFQGAV
jgi:hypothetical protein